MSVRTRTPVRVPGALRWFVGVVARRQTYQNLAYLASTFPLGLLYFVLLTTGLSVGVALLVVLVGAPILVGFFLFLDRVLVVERWLAANLVGVDVPLDREGDDEELWDYVRSPFTDLGTWIGVVYLFSKFVLGLATLVLLTTLGSFAGAFLVAPLYYRTATVEVQVPEPIHVTFNYAVQRLGGVEVISFPVTITSWQVTTLPEALAVAAVGVVLLVVSLHLCNLLAKLQGWYAQLLITPRPLA